MNWTLTLWRRSAPLTGALLVAAALGACTADRRLTGPSAPPEVASITISPASDSATVGDRLTFTAVPKDADGQVLSTRLLWSSGDTSVALVDTAGVVTAAGPGSTVINVAGGPVITSANLNVARAKVASVTVTPTPDTLPVGGTVQLSATPKSANGTPLTGRTVTWSTSSTAVAAVSSAGLVTAAGSGAATITATVDGTSGTASIVVPAAPTPPPVPVASVTVSPSSASFSVGATVQLTATVKDSAGNTLTGRTVSWSSSSSAIATVSSGGLVTGVAAGTASITATSGGKSGSSAVTVTAATSTTHAGWYAAPSGSSGGSGSVTSPWDLATALSGAGGRIQPGDTVWVRGGTYYAPFRSTLTGTAAAPMVVRAYPGERAIVDGVNTTSDNFTVAGSYVIIWGLEFTNTNPSRYTSDATSHSYRADNVVNAGPHNKYVNLVIHDGGVAFYAYSAYPDVEVSGSIIYDNGWDSTDRGHGHALYLKNDNGPLVAKNNVIFNQFGYGIHCYTNTGDGLLNGLWLEGNVSFDNGSLSALGTSANGGNLGQPLANSMGWVNNMTYFAPSLSGTNLTLGSGSGLTETGNYVVGGSGITIGTWSGTTISGNTVLASLAGLAAPRVFVRPNDYEPGRANVIVYNSAVPAGAVSADLTGVLNVGDSYVVRNVQDLWGTPVASGTYGGGSISIPMSGVSPPVPVGMTSSPAPKTGPYFDVFIVTRN